MVHAHALHVELSFVYSAPQNETYISRIGVFYICRGLMFSPSHR